jgi:hypothetical protein
VELIKKEHPNIYAASKALETWLGPDGIAGRPISRKKTLSIEAETPAALYEIEEVQDSNNKGDNNAVRSQTQIPPPSRHVSAALLRQMTLLELFHPVD